MKLYHKGLFATGKEVLIGDAVADEYSGSAYSVIQIIPDADRVAVVRFGNISYHMPAQFGLQWHDEPQLATVELMNCPECSRTMKYTGNMVPSTVPCGNRWHWTDEAGNVLP